MLDFRLRQIEQNVPGGIGKQIAVEMVIALTARADDPLDLAELPVISLFDSRGGPACSSCDAADRDPATPAGVPIGVPTVPSAVT